MNTGSNQTDPTQRAQRVNGGLGGASFTRLVGGGTLSVAAGGGVLGLTGCGEGMPAEAIEAWNGPALPPDADLRLWVLSFAILAPHSHNLQSWVVDLHTPDHIILYCDLQRMLPQTDPLARQILMSHGAFIELLDMAARERGLRCDVALFPQGVFGPRMLDGRAVATIRLTPDPAVRKDALFAHILRRHTNRNAYDATRGVPTLAWLAMVRATNPDHVPPVSVGFVGLEHGHAALERHRRIAQQAWTIELTTPRTIMESYGVLRIGRGEILAHRDGLSVTDPLVVAMAGLGLLDRKRAPAPDAYATTSQVEEFAAKLASTPGFVWLVTPDNDRATQIHAGRAYVRLQLAACAHGLSLQPLSQALQEYAEQQQCYADIHALVGATAPGATVQMWARVGYAPEVAPAPRRPLRDFIQA